MSNKWRTPYSQLLKALRQSINQKKKAGWKREVGAGFIKQDIESIEYAEPKVIIRFPWADHEFTPQDLKLYYPHTIAIWFTWGFEEFTIPDFNLRETEELLEFVLDQQTKYEIERIKEASK